MSQKFVATRPRDLAAATLVIAFTTLLQTRDVFGWAPVRWTNVSALARETLFLTGPLAAALAAYVARVNTTVVTTTVPGRPWAQIAGRHLSVLAPTATAGFAAGLAPAFVAAANRATSGGPDLLVIASGFTGLIALLTVGYLLGSLFGAPTGPVVAGVAALVFTGGLMVTSDVLSSSGVPISLFSVIPFWEFPLSRGSHEVGQVAGFRLFFFTVLAIAIGTLVVRLLDRRLARRRDKLKTGLKVLGPTFGLAVLALVVQPAVAASDSDPQVTCREITAGSLCVYQEEEAILGDVVSAIDEPVRRYGRGSLTGRFTTVRLEQLNIPLAPGDLVLVPQVNGDRAELRETLIYDTTRGMSGATECDRVLYHRYGPEYYDTAPDRAREADALAQLVAAELARRVGVQSVDTVMLPRDEGTEDWPATAQLRGVLAKATDERVRAWLAEHERQLRTCSLRIEDVQRWAS